MAAATSAMVISSLPEEIQAEILLQLPAKSILSCKCVCKLWLNLISSPRFINDHLHLSIKNKKNHKLMFTDKQSYTGNPLIYSIDYASISSTPDLSCDYIDNEAVLMDYPFEYKKGMEVRILGACNGLICFGILVGTKTSICIWNPATREYKEIQHCDFHMNPEQTSRTGFGYDCKTGDFKMVRIARYGKSDYSQVEIYTFGLHSSKTIRTFPYQFPTRVAFRGVFLRGALHWISNTPKQNTSDYIVSFDISNEKLVDVPLPEKRVIYPEDSNAKLYTKVGVLGDYLSLVIVDRKLVRAEVWIMQDYGVRESWTKLFTTTQSPFTSHALWMPVMSLQYGEILMYTVDGFVLCDPKNERVGKLSSFFQRNTNEVRGLTMVMAHPESYVESLVSLNSGTYVKKPKEQQLRDVVFRCPVCCDGYAGYFEHGICYGGCYIPREQRTRVCRGGGRGGSGKRCEVGSSGSDEGDSDENGGN